MVHVFDKLESFFISVDQSQGVVLWIHGEELGPGGQQDRNEDLPLTPGMSYLPETDTYLLVLFVGNVAREASKL